MYYIHISLIYRRCNYEKTKYKKITYHNFFASVPNNALLFQSCLIINAELNGVINGSFIVFALMFLLSIPFGSLFCTYLCPAGGLQECVSTINDKNPKQGWRNCNDRFFLWNRKWHFCFFNTKLYHLLWNCILNIHSLCPIWEKSFLSLLLLDGSIYGIGN